MRTITAATVKTTRQVAYALLPDIPSTFPLGTADDPGASAERTNQSVHRGAAAPSRAEHAFSALEGSASVEAKFRARTTADTLRV